MAGRVKVCSRWLALLLGGSVACGQSGARSTTDARTDVALDGWSDLSPDTSPDDGGDLRSARDTSPDTGASQADGSCGACVRQTFLDPNNYRAIKQQLKFQTKGGAYDYSSDSIKSAFADWSDDRSVIPNKPDFLDALEEAAAWLAAPDRFEDLRQPSTARSPDGGAAETGDNDNGTPYYYVPLAHAWKLFVWWTAHDIALDMAGALPWSMDGQSLDYLAPLLDSTEMMHRRIVDDVQLGHAPHQNFLGKPYASYLGTTILGAPRYTYRFLVSQGILKSTRRATITALLDWASAHLVHFEGQSWRSVCQDHWGHRYNPTVEMICEGTTRASDHKFAHWTMGCHGTNQFLKDVLRAVNIPMRLAYDCQHAAALFVSEDAYMTHGDHPYNLDFKASGCSTDYLLLGRSKWEALFGPGQVNHQDATYCNATPSPVSYSSLPEILATCR